MKRSTSAAVTHCAASSRNRRQNVKHQPRPGALTVLLQIFSYVAFSAGRQPQGIVEITGVTPPTW